MVVLEDIAEVRLGRQRSPKDHIGDQMRPYVRAANIGWSGWKLEDVKSMNFTDAEMRIYGLEPGDLLVGEASGSLREVGKPALWEGQIEACAFQNTLIRVRPRSADPKYLLHYFAYCAATGRFAERSRGVGIFHLGRKALAQMPVPFPPIDEQRRIAAILDAADVVRAKHQQAIAKLDTLTQAIFMDMFSPQSTGFPKRELRDLVSVKGGKRLPKGAEYAAAATQHPYVRVTDFKSGEIEVDDLRYLDEATHESISRYIVNEGDVVISIAGSIGQVAAVPRELDGANLTENAAKLVRKNPEQLRPEYLAAVLRSPQVQLQIGASTGQVTIGKLALFRIEKIAVPVPPVTLQHEYAKSLTSVRQVRRSAEQAVQKTEELFAALRQRAFRGEL